MTRESPETYPAPSVHHPKSRKSHILTRSFTIQSICYNHLAPHSPREPIHQGPHTFTVPETMPSVNTEKAARLQNQMKKAIGLQWPFSNSTIEPSITYRRTSTLLISTRSTGRSIPSVATSPMLLTTSIPFTTFPKTVCLPLR